MPVYTYECPVCHRREEQDRKVAERNVLLPVCCHVYREVDKAGMFTGHETAHAENMELVITSTSFQLKGRGWAKDGYGKGR